MPPHRVYIETHLGGGAVLRNKAPALFNVGIDRDQNVIQAFANQFDSKYRFVNGAAEDFLQEYHFQGDELIYADPPYWPSSRRSSRSPYRYDYTEADHLNLLVLLRQLPCRVMISGYENSEYEEALAGWNRINFVGTSHTGMRQEVVWFNFHSIVLHDTRYIGSTFHERQSVKRKRDRWKKRFCKEPVCVQQAILGDLADAFQKTQFNKSNHELFAK